MNELWVAKEADRRVRENCETNIFWKTSCVLLESSTTAQQHNKTLELSLNVTPLWPTRWIRACHGKTGGWGAFLCDSLIHVQSVIRLIFATLSRQEPTSVLHTSASTNNRPVSIAAINNRKQKVSSARRMHSSIKAARLLLLF